MYKVAHANFQVCEEWKKKLKRLCLMDQNLKTIKKQNQYKLR